MHYEPDPNLQHFLVVRDNCNEPTPLRVLHDARCPAQTYRDAAGYGAVSYDCAVAFEIFNAGLGDFFRHRDAAGGDDNGALSLAPGCYPLEAWSTRELDDAGQLLDWDGGLRVVDAPVVAMVQDGGPETSEVL